MSLLTLIGPEQAQHRWQAHERNAEKADLELGLLELILTFDHRVRS